MKLVKKVPQTYSLSTINGRVGLLCGITAGTVSREEVEAAVLHDTETRQYRKPVVVPNHSGGEVRFGSVRSAAAFLLRIENFGHIPKGINYSRKLSNIAQRISRYCNADNVPHYYWSE
jgi:hypothetical protein